MSFEVPPAVLPGDWVELDQPDGLLSLAGALAEVQEVLDNGAYLSLIVGGRMFVSASWAAGDRWQKVLPPESVPPSWVRASAAPGEGLKTAHPWRQRPAPTHPLVLSLEEEWRGWLLATVSGDEQRQLTDVVSAAWYRYYETGSTAGWEEEADPSGLSQGQIDKAVALGAFIAEADSMNDGFVVHAYTPDLDVDVRTDDDRKGLEQLIEMFEDLGFDVRLSDKR